jgi:hypothetical protein
MDIRLVSHVEHNVVVRRGKNAVNGKGKLNRTEIGRKMTAVFGHSLNQIRSDLLCEQRQLLLRERLKILGGIDRKETWITGMRRLFFRHGPPPFLCFVHFIYYSTLPSPCQADAKKIAFFQANFKKWAFDPDF